MCKGAVEFLKGALLTWDWLSDAGARALVAFLSTGALSIIGFYLRPRARIIYSALHQFTFGIPQQQPAQLQAPAPQQGQPQLPPPTAQTGQPPQPILLEIQTLFIQNVGRGRAETVDVVLNFRPMHFAVWPVRPYSEHFNPDGRFIIRFTNMNRFENLTIEMLGPNLPMVLGARSDAGPGLAVQMNHVRRFSNAFTLFLVFLMFLGICTIFYGAFGFLAWLLPRLA